MSEQKASSYRDYIMGIVHNLPECPGCYQYLNEEGEIIYVGKAKNLKRRVSSYFNKTQTGKTKALVDNIRDSFVGLVPEGDT